MAEQITPVPALVDINNRGTHRKATVPAQVAAKLVVDDGRLVPDDRATNPGVLV